MLSLYRSNLGSLEVILKVATQVHVMVREMDIFALTSYSKEDSKGLQSEKKLKSLQFRCVNIVRPMQEQRQEQNSKLPNPTIEPPSIPLLSLNVEQSPSDRYYG